MSTTKLAVLNIFRNRRRTMITVGSVAFGIWLAASFVGTREHTYTKLVDAAVRMGSGHISIARAAYLATPGPTHPLAHIDTLTATIFELAPGVAVYPRVFGNGIIASAERSAGITYMAVDPTTESAKHNLLLGSIANRQALSENKFFIGTLLATQLGVGVGDRLVLTVGDRAGQVNSHLAIVGGIFKTGNRETDGAMILCSLSLMQKILGYTDHEASILAVYVNGFASIHSTHDILQKSIDSSTVQVTDWNLTQKDLSQFIRYDSAVYRILIFFVGIIIVSGILNTLVISIIERRREFGVMLALGMSPVNLFRLIVAEGFFLGLLGIGVGTVSYIPLYWYLNRYGIDLTGLLSETIDAGGISIAFIMKCELTLLHCSIIAGSILLLTLVASLYPAWKAATIVPVRSLHQ